ncbi:MAG TPA: alpha/beta hydrolase, partial [Methylococcaceae bacterium]|nr:alpha/beta hydrolase [Methylococcaceae bacterium]
MRHVTRRSVIFSALFSAALLGVHPDVFARRIDEATYQYPYKNPYVATTTVGIMKGNEDFSADDIRDIEIGILA